MSLPVEKFHYQLPSQLDVVAEALVSVLRIDELIYMPGDLRQPGEVTVNGPVESILFFNTTKFTWRLSEKDYVGQNFLISRFNRSDLDFVMEFLSTGECVCICGAGVPIVEHETDGSKAIFRIAVQHLKVVNNTFTTELEPRKDWGVLEVDGPSTVEIEYR